MMDSLIRSALGVVMAVVLQTADCGSVGVGVDVGDDGVNVDVNVDGSGGSGGIVPSDSIRVRFANKTPQALDVQFHAAGTTGEDLADSLFVEANLITEGLGFAGTGLIDAGKSDELTILCADAAVLGTSGGVFVDSDTGQQIGEGQQRIAVRDLQYDCGETVTFVFDDNGSSFETAMLID